jgi:hypothetical protein
MLQLRVPGIKGSRTDRDGIRSSLPGQSTSANSRWQHLVYIDPPVDQ